MALADTSATDYQFLTKVWAKQKIEHLLVLYYSLDPESPEAEALKEEIIELSLDYGVMTPFTQFGPPTGVEEGEDAEGEEELVPAPYTLLGNFPNPFNPVTTIRFQIESDLQQIVFVRIYDVRGQLVKILAIPVHGAGTYGVMWDGTNQEGLQVASGVYIYTVDFGDAVLASRMILLK